MLKTFLDFVEYVYFNFKIVIYVCICALFVWLKSKYGNTKNFADVLKRSFAFFQEKKHFNKKLQVHILNLCVVEMKLSVAKILSLFSYSQIFLHVKYFFFKYHIFYYYKNV